MTGDHDFRVRTEARNAIARIVKDAGGQMTDRPVMRSRPDATVREPEPRAGIRAAVALERAARRNCLDFIRSAREDGLSWAQVAEALGFGEEAGDMTPAERAYDYASPYRAASPSWFAWSCECGGLVRDYGPELGPAEGEKGHAEGCARFAAAVAAWNALEEDDADA